MIGIYVRVSGADQNDAGQRRDIERWIAGNGLTDVRWFTDKATGDNLDRPAFKALQEAVFHGEIRTVVCWRLDRISRSLRDGIGTLCDWLDAGVRVVAVSQSHDFSGKTGKLIASVLFSVAEMETEVRRERQAAGISAAKDRGDVYLGRQRGATTASPTRAAELHRQGFRDSEIASALDVSKRTVQRDLTANKDSPNA